MGISGAERIRSPDEGSSAPAGRGDARRTESGAAPRFKITIGFLIGRLINSAALRCGERITPRPPSPPSLPRRRSFGQRPQRSSRRPFRRSTSIGRAGRAHDKIITVNWNFQMIETQDNPIVRGAGGRAARPTFAAELFRPVIAH